jgi:hypothetical protein
MPLLGISASPSLSCHRERLPACPGPAEVRRARAWRETICVALLSGVLLFASAGASRACELPAQPREEIDLSGQWKFQLDWHDKGLSLGWQKPEFDDSAWGTINVPGYWEDQGRTQFNRAWQPQPSAGDYNGYAWYRREFSLPETWRDRQISLELGGVADNDWAYVNGTPLGGTQGAQERFRLYRLTSQTTMGFKGAQERFRLYRLTRESREFPSMKLNFGPQAVNHLAIRVCNISGRGGIWKEPVRLMTSETAKGIVRIGADVQVPEGMVVEGDVVCVGGAARVDGQVRGNLVVALGNIRLGPRAEVGGDLVHWGGKLDKAPTARIDGDFIRVGSITGPARTQLARQLGALGVLVPGLAVATKPAAQWLVLLSTFAVLAILSVALFPRQMCTMEQTVRENSGRSLFLGALFILLIPLATLALAFTIVGILLVPLEIVLILIMFLGGYLAVALALGRRILELIWAGGAEKTLLAAVVGAVILVGLRALPVVGLLLTIVAVVVGFGVAGASALGTQPDFLRRRRRPPAPPAAPAPSIESPDTGV